MTFKRRTLRARDQEARNTSKLTDLEICCDDLRVALQRIADEPCDHGPGFCPREHAKTTLAQLAYYFPAEV